MLWLTCLSQKQAVELLSTPRSARWSSAVAPSGSLITGAVRLKTQRPSIGDDYPCGGVVVRRVSRSPTRLVCVDVDAAAVAGDDRTVTLRDDTGSDQEYERVFVDEGRQRVRVAVVERVSYGLSVGIGVQREAETVLSEPLGWNVFVGAGIVIVGVAVAEGRLGSGPAAGASAVPAAAEAGAPR